MNDLGERYARLYLGVVYDAMRFDLDLAHPFVLDRAIKPGVTLEQPVLFGHAFTCRGMRVASERHLDDTVRLRMFERFTAGCVQVIDCGGDDTVAHFGDISGKLARKFGALGAVIDGYTRDARIIEQDRFPLFCRGAQPQDAYGRWQIVAFQEPVALAGPEGPVRIAPGDWMFGDADGVIAIPETLGERACELAERRLEREDTIRRELTSANDIEALYERVGRW